MHNSKLIHLLKTFSPPQQRRFLEFIHSPYFNKHEVVRNLGDYLVPLAPFQNNKQIQRERVWNILFPNEALDDKKFNNLMSKLLKLAYEFMGQERYLSSPGETFHFQVKALIEQDQLVHAERILPRYERALQESPHKSINHYMERLQFHDLCDQLYIARSDRTYDLNLQLKNQYLDQFFTALKWRISCDMYSRNQIINTEYAPTFLNLAKKILETSKNINISERIYFQAFELLQGTDTENQFNEFLQLLNANRQHFAPEERWVLYNYALNHCIRQINTGYSGYYSKLHLLYQEMLEGNILHKNGFLTQWDFKNIVTVGLRIQDFEWTARFISNYLNNLHPDEQENARVYNLASLYYAQKDYTKALRQLHQVEFTDTSYHLGAKIIQLKCYFEIGETEPFLALTEAFKKYVQRNRSIGSYRKLANLNFINLSKAVYELKEKKKRITKEKFLITKEKLSGRINITEPVANKDWIKEKLD